MKLHILNGPDKGLAFDLGLETTYVGRSSENDIQIKDGTISRKHLKITRKDEKFFIEDLRSKNGTILEGARITPGESVEVKEGIPISIGTAFFSLGKPWSGDLPPARTSSEDPEDASRTRTIQTVRPSTSSRNLELIYKVSEILIRSLDINEILVKILDHIFELLKRTSRAAIILRDHETGKISEIISRSRKPNDETVVIKAYSRTVVDQVFRESKPVVLFDILAEDPNKRSKSMEMMRIRSALCVPLISKTLTKGVIYVDSTERNGFRKEDISLLTALSGPAAVAIENALLYSNLETIIEKRTKALRQTETKLRESEARFKAIFDNMSSGVVVYSPVNNGEDFIVVDLNKSDERIEKIKRSQKLGKSVLEAPTTNREIKPSLLDILKKVWKTGKPEHCPITISRGDKISVARDYYVYRLPSGEIVAIYDDVTGKKKGEADQRKLQEQLYRSQKMESIGAFAGGTAHNFRNILQAISGNIEYLETVCADRSEVKELARSIYASIEKGVDLINNLLHFSQKNGEYQYADVDLADVILETHKIIDRVFDKNIKVQLDLGEALFVRGNRTLLSQVFMNLFTNARDAMPNGGRLSMVARKSGAKIVIRISDTGHGMDKETLGKIFDPFFTLKEVGKGTGLGLSTTHGIVEQHGGSISVQSSPGQGATFTIILPSVKAVKRPDTSPQRDLIRGKGEKVLIIDDEEPALEALAKLIKTLGYKAISTDRPMEALKQYRKWSPDVVLIDRSMPEMDGITCMKEIMKIDPDANVIIVSGYERTGPNGIDEVTSHLINGYITKPCKIEDLSWTISQTLQA